MTDFKITRIDDLNWGRLNLISAQDSIAGQHHWQVDLSQGNRLVKITCRALPEYGIPHGLDNDVSSALIDYYQSCDLPEDGKISISMTDLLMLAGFPRNGKYWALLKTSLERLHTTSYSISGGWRDHPNRRWTTAKFHFIEGIEYTHEGEAGKFDSRTVLQIKLADPLVTSLRSGYTKPLNIEFMHSLSRPRTRILFRLLDAMRYNPEEIDETVDAFSVRLIEWADQCKLPNARPDLIRRALAAPHEELIKRGYLHSVTYEGRGRTQNIHYTFSPEFTPVSPALLNRFRKHGVADGVTRQFVRTYTTSVLHGRIDLFEQLVKNGQLVVKKTPAAALVHLIKHADQYGSHGPAQALPAAAPRPSTEKTTPLETPPLDVAAELAPLTPEGRATFVMQRIGLLYKKDFTPLDFDLLRDAVIHERVDAASIVTLGIHSRANRTGEAFVSALRQELYKN